MGVILHNVATELPRELVVCGGIWLFGLLTGALWAHRKIVRPARERHIELLAHHKVHAEHLQAIREKVE